MDKELAEVTIRLEQLHDALSFAGAKLYRSPHKEMLKSALRREIHAAERRLDELLAELAGDTISLASRRNDA